MADVEDWRAFVAVAGSLSFVAAARSLGRSPQSITRAIAALEARLNTRLLLRTTRSVSLSSDGERYLERARRVVSDLDNLESPLDSNSPLSGALSITAPVLFGQIHVLPVVSRFLALHDGVLVKASFSDRLVSLADEAIDLGVRIGDLSDSSLHAVRVGSVRTIHCASPAYLRKAGPLDTLEQLGGHACIAFTATCPVPERWAFPGHRDRDRSIGVHPRLVVNTGQAAIDAALAGLGVVRVLSYQVDELIKKGRLRHVLGDFDRAPVPVQVVRLPGVQSRLSQAFLDFAVASLRVSLPTLVGAASAP